MEHTIYDLKIYVQLWI